MLDISTTRSRGSAASYRRGSNLTGGLVGLNRLEAEPSDCRSSSSNCCRRWLCWRCCGCCGCCCCGGGGGCCCCCCREGADEGPDEGPGAAAGTFVTSGVLRLDPMLVPGMCELACWPRPPDALAAASLDEGRETARDGVVGREYCVPASTVWRLNVVRSSSISGEEQEPVSVCCCCCCCCMPGLMLFSRGRGAELDADGGLGDARSSAAVVGDEVIIFASLPLPLLLLLLPLAPPVMMLAVAAAAAAAAAHGGAHVGE